MKTTQPKKRGRPVGSKNKFKSNPFTKKYKEELKKYEITKDQIDQINEHVAEIKSWKRERAWGLVSWLKGKPDLTRGELYISILIGCTIGNILTNL